MRSVSSKHMENDCIYYKIRLHNMQVMVELWGLHDYVNVVCFCENMCTFCLV